MTEPWWRRRKKRGPWFNDIHEELERLGDLIDETIKKAFETASLGNTPIHHNHIRGFSVNFGSDGKPTIRELGSREFGQDEAEVSEGFEPLVDLVDEGETFAVLVSLPGVNKEAIDLRVTANRLTVSVDTANLECYKELKLPAKVDPKSARALYKNGVLEVKLKKSEKKVRDSKISLKK